MAKTSPEVTLNDLRILYHGMTPNILGGFFTLDQGCARFFSFAEGYEGAVLPKDGPVLELMLDEAVMNLSLSDIGRVPQRVLSKGHQGGEKVQSTEKLHPNPYPEGSGMVWQVFSRLDLDDKGAIAAEEFSCGIRRSSQDFEPFKVEPTSVSKSGGQE